MLATILLRTFGAFVLLHGAVHATRLVACVGLALLRHLKHEWRECKVELQKLLDELKSGNH